MPESSPIFHTQESLENVALILKKEKTTAFGDISWFLKCLLNTKKLFYYNTAEILCKAGYSLSYSSKEVLFSICHELKFTDPLRDAILFLVDQSLGTLKCQQLASKKASLLAARCHHHICCLGCIPSDFLNARPKQDKIQQKQLKSKRAHLASK